MDTGHPGKSTIQRCCTCSDDSSQLNEVNHPITVLFYGDHLPGFYSTAYFDKKNILGLHETDYFIWPNQASCSTNTKLDAVSSDYTSSNYFSVQLAEHLNAKVSPCLAFLTEMHQAMSVPDSSGSSAPTYLDANGNLIKKKNLSKQAKQLLHDYQLIQYDMSVGKNYLKDTGFVDLPEWPVYNRLGLRQQWERQFGYEDRGCRNRLCWIVRRVAAFPA
ncbi:hypothetical protein JL738_08235 [Bifidobacterium longum subsp. suis]|nr:hypothetical protein [Bifidobacterium longum]MBL3916581.1 hypothetical protein [Bifidobacterium longum subsp. suis]